MKDELSSTSWKISGPYQMCGKLQEELEIHYMVMWVKKAG